MKVFRITSTSVGYDEFDSCVVVAESEEAVRKMISVDTDGWRNVDCSTSSYCDDVWFSKYQGDLKISEIDLNKPQVICASYNAG